MGQLNFPKDMKLGWAMPLTWPYINSDTHLSLMAMKRPDFIYLETPRGGDIGEKRQAQVEYGMKEGCTHFIFLDADMVYHPNTLVDLFEVLEDADLAGGLCYRGYPPYDPLIWHPTEERLLKPFKDYKFGDVVDAGSTGCACLLVKRQVFEGLPLPWFTMAVEKVDRDGKEMLLRRGEDTYFTRNATKAGFKLKVMTKYDIGHLREMQVDRHFWLIHAIIGRLGSWENAIILLNKLNDPKWIESLKPTKKVESAEAVQHQPLN